MNGLTRDGTGELVSRDQILRRERGQNMFLCSAHHEQDWQPNPSNAQSAKYVDHIDVLSYNYLDHTWLRASLRHFL